MLSTSGVNPMVFTSGSRPHHDEALVEEMFAHGLRVGSCALRLWRPVENRRHFDLVVSGDMKKFNDFQSLSKEQLMLNVLSQILQCLALALSFFPDNVQLEKNHGIAAQKSWVSSMVSLWFPYDSWGLPLWLHDRPKGSKGSVPSQASERGRQSPPSAPAAVALVASYFHGEIPSKMDNYYG